MNTDQRQRVIQWTTTANLLSPGDTVMFDSTMTPAQFHAAPTDSACVCIPARLPARVPN